MSRINTTHRSSYRHHKPYITGYGARAAAAGGRSAPIGGVAPRCTAVRTKGVKVGAACGFPGVTLVDARGADDCEPAQHLPRGGAQCSHREAAHDARLRAREPAFLALEAELTVVTPFF